MEMVSTAELIDSLDQGNFAYVLGEKMKTLVKAVKETGKGGDLTIKIKITPMPKFGDAVSISPDLRVNIPQQSYRQAIKFITEDGMLVGTDPNQRTFGEISADFNNKRAAINQ